MRRILLFTDIEGSTRLWESHPEAMSAALSEHDRLMASLIPAYSGRVVKNTGDGVFAAFPPGSDVLGCLLKAHAELSDPAKSLGVELRLRSGMHAAEVEERNGDLFGSGVGLAQRVMDSGRGGQTLLTEAAAGSIPLPCGGSLADLGLQRFRDLTTPMQLFSFHHPALPAASLGPLRTLSAVPNNLLRPLTPFVGRERELLEITALLRGDGARLVTILGPGGVGKSRLALQAAAEVSSRFPDGVYFVSMAELEDAGLVLPAVVEVMELRPDPGGCLEEGLVSHLSGRRTLLVLDNMEHLTASAAKISHLLERIPGLSVLVTSRQRLRLPVEQVYPLAGLDSVGQASGGGSREGLALFLDTARRVIGPVELAEAETEAAVAICRRLDGNPLGIILAASWSGVIPPGAILAELGSGLSLTSNVDGLPARHESLRETLLLSWNLLEPCEQRMLCRLSRFRGGFQRGEAAAVCDLDLPGISSLVDKSLVERFEDGRFGIHALVLALVRGMAGEVLGPDGLEETARRHGEFFLDRLAAVAEDLERGDRDTAAAGLSGSIDNIRESWRFFVERLDTVRMLSSCRALKSLLGIRGSYEEGESLFSTAVARLASSGGSAASARLRAWLLCCQGWFSSYCRPGAESIRLLEESVLLFRGTDDLTGLSWALNQMGNGLYVDGDYIGAGTAYAESLELMRRTGEDLGVSAVWNNLGNLACERKDYDEAERFYNESLAIDRRLGNPHGASACLANLAVVALACDRLEKASVLLDEAMALEGESCDRFSRAILRGVSARVLMKKGDLSEAEAICTENLAVYRELGNAWGEAETRQALSGILLLRGDRAGAAGQILEALDRAITQRWRPQLSELLDAASGLLGRDMDVTGSGGAPDLERACLAARDALREAVHGTP